VVSGICKLANRNVNWFRNVLQLIQNVWAGDNIKPVL